MQDELIELVTSLAKSGTEPQATWVNDGYLDTLNDQLQWSKENKGLFV